MTVTITDKEIEKAVIAYTEEYLNRLAAMPDTHSFSDRYEKRKTQIIALGAKPQHRRRPHRMLRSVAAALLVMVLSFSMVMAFSTTARAAVSNWLKEAYNSIVRYEFAHKEDDHAYIICAPAALPEGLERTRIVRTGSYTLKEYEDLQTGTFLRFEYSKATDAMIAEVEKQSKCAELLIKSGAIEKYCLDNGASRRVFWYDQNRQLVFFVDSNLERDALAASLASISLRLPMYEPTWLPEGYEEVERNTDYPSVDVIYVGQNDDSMICYMFSDMAETDLIAIYQLGDDLTPEAVLINGITGEYYAYKDAEGGDLVWVNEQLNLAFVISATLSKDNMIALAESIVCVETEW